MTIAEIIAGRRSLKLLLASAVLLLASCGNNAVYEETAIFDNAEWKIADTAVFRYTPASIQTPRNINIGFEHATDYQYGNIFLFTDIVFPSGKTLRDTLQYVFVDHNYDWAGKGSGDTRLTMYPFKQAVTFPEEGTYTFKLCQAMRVGEDSTLYGINSVSLIIK